MKPIAKILVPLTGAERDVAALTTAFEVAGLFNAHVEAVMAHPDPQAAVPQVGVPFSLDVVEAIIVGQEQYTREAEAAARKMLARLCAEMNVGMVEKPCAANTVTCSFRNDGGTLPTVVPNRARLSDLVVFPSLRLAGFVDIQETFLNVLTGVGRPVLVSAESPTGRITRSIAIGWDGSRCAARAVSAALPFLRGAERVHVLEIQPGRARPAEDDLEQYLALHGVICSRKSVHLDAPSTGDMLAEEAARSGADLLVIGGYGHSHLRETFLGGVTSDVLGRAQLPVFLAH